ncbi:hypothetical protein HGRIS_014036 [Hohenbuehelia grisea]|uniref:Uncharacterized protein n=1 Tax=Hohenbuehelia grisea TaxID=104357 RepID=A0ABR3JU56_9AGAR
MDFIKNAAQNLNNAGNNDNNNNSNDPKNAVMGALNTVMGGGKSAEEKEDMLDKAIDYAQEHVLKQGPQDNEDAVEQATDKIIAGAVRDQYKKLTGNEFPLAEKK